jgi:thioredoxin-related protein
MSNSDLDQESYLELMKESAKTGKSVQQILKERHQAEGVIYSDKTPAEASKEVREFLAKNTWIIKPNKEENNE